MGVGGRWLWVWQVGGYGCGRYMVMGVTIDKRVNGIGNV
jgi:hypothetical protein